MGRCTAQPSAARGAVVAIEFVIGALFNAPWWTLERQRWRLPQGNDFLNALPLHFSFSLVEGGWRGRRRAWGNDAIFFSPGREKCSVQQPKTASGRWAVHHLSTFSFLSFLLLLLFPMQGILLVSVEISRSSGKRREGWGGTSYWLTARLRTCYAQRRKEGKGKTKKPKNLPRCGVN